MAHDRQKVSRPQVGAVIAPVLDGIHDDDVEAGVAIVLQPAAAIVDHSPHLGIMQQTGTSGYLGISCR
jgi:hypothetical protein